MSEENKRQDLEVIDLPSALERIGGDESFLRELINIYVEEFQAKFAELKEAVARADFPTIQALGHSLKGSSANLSLFDLQKIAHSLEIAGQEKDAVSSRQNLENLEAAFQRLLAQLKNFPWWSPPT